MVMVIKRILVAALVLIGAATAQAQEVLLPLQRTAAQTGTGQKSTSTVALPFFDDFANCGNVPSPSLWENIGATTGTGFGELPPTIGMATLDALGPDGRIYPQASTSPFPADTLCSQPIQLDSFSPADSLVFSFFYLPGGGSGNLWERVGDTPDDADSLFLDFYRASDSTWQTVWARGGICVDTLMAHTGTAWQYVAVPVADPAYFDSTFRFRFRNHCSLESTEKTGMRGNCDQWNIDYVLLDTARSVTAQPQWRDIAFVSPAPSMLRQYQAMPARQFRTAELSPTLPATITNLFEQELASHYGYFVLGENGDTLYSYDGGFENAPAVGYQTAAAHANAPLGYTPPANGIPASYTVVHTVSEGVGGDSHRQNDTTVFHLVFADYYAYDDGEAENGYGLTSTAARVYLAYRFDLNQEDTLTAVDMCFNRTAGGENEAVQFYITVWQANSEGKPGTVLYRDVARRTPQFSPTGGFCRYLLETSVVASGSIFVGFEQVGNDFINLGFDRNTQSADRIWYLTSTAWQQSILRGSLLLRPHFGVAATVGIGGTAAAENGLRLYPNPATDILRIGGLTPNSTLHIYDCQGRTVKTITANAESIALPVDALPAGLYMLRATNPAGIHSTAKIIIRH